MKKKRAVAGGLLLVLGIAQSVSAGTTTVTYHVDPSYMVLVPANTTIPFNEESVNYGKICVEEAQIEEGKCIQVELISDKKLKNQSGKEGEIPYEILADTTAFTKARYTTAGEETVLGITIDRESWKRHRQAPMRIRLLFRYPMWMRQIRTGGWTDEKGSNYSDGDLPVPLHTRCGRGCADRYFVRYAAKHHQHDSTGYPHGHDTIRTCTGELSA